MKRARHFKVLRPTLLLCLLSVATSGLATTVRAQANDRPYRVLVLYWDNKDFPGNVRFDENFKTVLQSELPGKVEYYPEYLETTRFPGQDQSFFRDYLRQKYAGRAIDIVVVNADAPMNLMLANRSELFPTAPIVFVATAPPATETLLAGPGMTGIVHQTTHRQTLEMALRLHPDTKQVFVISGSREQDKRFEKIAMQELTGFENRVQLTYLTDLPLKELMAKTASLPHQSIALYVWQQALDENGTLLETFQVLSRISPASSVPIYGLGSGNFGRGIVGGYLQGPDNNGRKTAEISVRILKGTPARDIPVAGAPSLLAFDWRELKRWRISEGSLPAGSVVSFRQFTIWDQYKWYILALIAAILIEGILIAGLLITQRKRRRAEEIAAQAHLRLKETVSNVHGIVWEANYEAKTNQRRTTFISDYVHTMLGYTAEEWMAQSPGFGLKIMLEEDRANVALATETALETGKDTSYEFRWRAKDGRIVWVQTHLAPVLNQRGQPVGLRGVSLDITERKRAEQTAQRTQETNRAILEAIPDLMFLQTRDGVYLDLHYTDPTKLIVRPEEYIGKNMREILPPELAEKFAHHFQRAIEADETQIVEYQLTVNGEHRWYESRLVCSGENILSVVRDITERKQAEEASRTQARNAALRADVSSALAEREAPLQAILQRITEAVVQHLGAAFARIWTLNKEEEVLELQASAGLYTHLDGQHARVRVGELKIGLIAKEGRPHLTNDVVGDSRVSDQQWAKDQGIVAFVGYPLKVEEKLVGVIAIFARHRLTEHTIEALASVADTIAQGVERRQAEAALSESDARLRRAQEAARVGTWEWDLKTGQSIWSDMIWELLGLTPNGPGHVDKFVEFIHPADRERAQNKVREVIAEGEDYYDEFRIVQRDGRVLWVSSQGRVLRSAEGAAERVIGVNVDISRRKQAEETAQETQQKDTAILNAIPDLMFLQTRDGVYLDYHARNTKDLLLKPQDFIGKNMMEVLPPDLATRLAACFERAVTSSDPQIIEYQLQRNGTSEWFEARIVRSGENILSVVRDITERKRALDELRLSEERFGKAFRANPQPMTLTVLHSGQYVDVNDAFIAVSGYTREELMGQTSLDLGIWENPESRAEFVAQVQEGGSVVNVETTLCAKDGSRHILLSSAELIELGGERCLLVASSDITERKKALDELRESEERFATAFRSNPQPMTLTTLADGQFVDVNDAFLAISGYHRDEVIGHTALDLGIWDTPDFRADFIQKLKEGGAIVNLEATVRAKDGAQRLLLMSAEQVELNGEKCVLVASTDITERKRAEEALLESEEKYRTLFESIDEGFCVFELIYDESGRADDFVFRVTNPAFERQTGWKSVVGMRVRELAPDLEEYWFEKYAQVAATNTPVRFMDWAAALNRWYEVYAFSVGEAGSRTVAVIFSDVSERVRAEQTLQESEARFRNMADDAPVLIWISDAANQCTYVNKQWLDFTGQTVDQELGVGWTEGIHPDDVERCRQTYAGAAHGREPFRLEYRLRRADGEYRWLLDRGTPRLSAAGEFLGYIGSCIDITDRKESEVAMAKAHDELITAHEEVSRMKNELEVENIYLQEALQLDQRLGEMVGESNALKYVLFKINQVAGTDSTVLITGETGTGKELVASAIHNASPRKSRPLIKVNCAALPASLIESELFGYEKGAFSGATARKMGRFELATGGTIFLDEIGDLPLESQVKLLRTIQDGELERLGGTKTIKVDVRIIAATNRDLKSEVEKGTFRGDLWYRLNVFPITVPPLRQRKDDIPLLVEYFVSQFAKKFGKTITSISPGTMERLKSYPWPGNVRELVNVIERSVIHTRGEVLHVIDVFESAQQAPLAVKSLEQVEREYILNILEHTGWRIEGPRGAAKLLGLNPSTLRTRMIKLGIHKPGAAPNGHNLAS